MLLILSKGGRGVKELTERLSALSAEYMFHFESLSQAGGFGKGDVMVGPLGYKSLARMVRQYNISAIVDIISTPADHGSLVAINVAEDMKLPLIKYIEPTVPRNVGNLLGGVKCGVDYSYASVAAKINNTVGNAVFFSKPMNVRVITEQVFDRNALYVPIRAAAEFDVDLALEYGVPLLNVREYNDFGGRAGIEKVLRDTQAKLLITDSAMDIADKLSAAGETGAEVVFTQSSGYEYKYIYDSYDALCGFLEERSLLNKNRVYDDPETEEEMGEGVKG